MHTHIVCVCGHICSGQCWRGMLWSMNYSGQKQEKHTKNNRVKICKVASNMFLSTGSAAHVEILISHKRPLDNNKLPEVSAFCVCGGPNKFALDCVLLIVNILRVVQLLLLLLLLAFSAISRNKTNNSLGLFNTNNKCGIAFLFLRI